MPTFDEVEPLSFFARCHTETREHCALLEKLIEGGRAAREGPSMREQVEPIVGFFEGPARDHHADEEIVFFPLLLSVNMDPGVHIDLKRLIESLHRDHRSLAALWDDLHGAMLLSERGIDSGLVTEVHTFVAVQRHHMNREDSGVLPIARRYLDTDALRALGSAIVDRRMGKEHD